MATYRLKSKLFGEFDGEKKKDGLFGTGISLGQAALAVGAAKIGMKGYNKFQKNQFSKNLQNIQWKQNQIANSGIVGAKSAANKFGKESINNLIQQ